MFNIKKYKKIVFDWLSYVICEKKIVTYDSSKSLFYSQIICVKKRNRYPMYLKQMSNSLKCNSTLMYYQNYIFVIILFHVVKKRDNCFLNNYLKSLMKRNRNSYHYLLGVPLYSLTRLFYSYIRVVFWKTE